MKLGSDIARKVGDKGYIAERLNRLIVVALGELPPNYSVESGEFLQDALVENAVSRLPGYGYDSESPGEDTSYLPPMAAEFLRGLERDGFTVSEGALRRALPVDIELPAAQSEIDRLLEKHGLTTPKGHLKQALEAHARGNWAAANSQIRTFLDALLDEIAIKLDPAAATLGSGQPRRTKLASVGFLSRDLHEWDDKGHGFMNGLAKRLHPSGSHPGLSDDEDSTFRLHVVLLTARLLLTRFDTWGRA